MVKDVKKSIDEFLSVEPNIITFHYEACINDEEVFDTIRLIKTLDKKVGLSIKPETNPEAVFKFLSELDLVLIMTVNPGFGGQEFIHDCAMKIPIIKEKATSNLIIQVDGGINNLTSKICISLGANSLVAGSYIYKSNDYQKAIETLIK